MSKLFTVSDHVRAELGKNPKAMAALTAQGYGTPSDVPDDLCEAIWLSKCMTIYMQQSFFLDKFVGTSENSIIQKITELGSKAGTSVTYPLMLPLVNFAQLTTPLDDGTLDGQEEAMNFRSAKVTVHEYGNAIRLKGALTEQKTSISLRTSARTLLEQWKGRLTDLQYFVALSSNPTNKVFVNDRANLDAIVAGDIFNCDVIANARFMAINNNLCPVRIDGDDVFVMVISPEAAKQLRGDQTWLDAQKYAGDRGNKANNIFTGMLGMYQGVVVHEHTNTQFVKNTGNVVISANLFMGAQAGVLAEAKAWNWVEDPLKDYKRKVGFATTGIYGIGKNSFKNDGTNLKDFGVEVVYSAAPKTKLTALTLLESTADRVEYAIAAAAAEAGVEYGDDNPEPKRK